MSAIDQQQVFVCYHLQLGCIKQQKERNRIRRRKRKEDGMHEKKREREKRQWEKR